MTTSPDLFEGPSSATVCDTPSRRLFTGYALPESELAHISAVIDQWGAKALERFYAVWGLRCSAQQADVLSTLKLLLSQYRCTAQLDSEASDEEETSHTSPPSRSCCTARPKLPYEKHEALAVGSLFFRNDPSGFKDCLSRLAECFLNEDLRKLDLFQSRWTQPPSSFPLKTIEGPLFCQLLKVSNISQPSRLAAETEVGRAPSQSRLLMLALHDGEKKFHGIEVEPCPMLRFHFLVFRMDLYPGTKLLLNKTENTPLDMRFGILLLRPCHIHILGGYVRPLVASWKANKEVALHRASKSRNLKAASNGEGPPSFVPFNSKSVLHTVASKPERNASSSTPVTASLSNAVRPPNKTASPPDDLQKAAPRETIQQTRQLAEPVHASAPASSTTRQKVASSTFAPASQPTRGRGRGRRERPTFRDHEGSGRRIRDPQHDSATDLSHYLVSSGRKGGLQTTKPTRTLGDILDGQFPKVSFSPVNSSRITSVQESASALRLPSGHQLVSNAFPPLEHDHNEASSFGVSQNYDVEPTHSSCKNMDWFIENDLPLSTRSVLQNSHPETPECGHRQQGEHRGHQGRPRARGQGHHRGGGRGGNRGRARGIRENRREGVKGRRDDDHGNRYTAY